MASQSHNLENHERESKRVSANAIDIPLEIWEEIIAKLQLDRHFNLHLQSLSRVCKLFLSITNLHKQTLKISNPSSHLLPSLFHRFPNLKHLNLSNHKRLLVEALERLPASTLCGVKSLNISSLSYIGHGDLMIIAKLFPNLEDLDLTHSGYHFRTESSSDESSCDEYSTDESSSDEDDGEDDFGGFREDKDINDCGILLLASKLKGLRRISLNGQEWITDKSVKLLSKNCPNLEEMAVKDCTNVTDTGIKSVLTECKNLKTFGLRRGGVRIDEIIPKWLCQAPSLSVIDFTYMDVSDPFLLAMIKANLPLKSFSLIHCLGFTYDGISSFLTSYDSLDHFALVGVGVVSDENMIILAKSLAELASVKLNHCPKLSESTLFTLVEQCPLLEAVEMKNTNIGKEGFRAGNALNPRIKTLNLSSNKNVSNESLKRIVLAFPNLETLLLKSCIEITGKGVGRTMRKCRGLKHLEIDGCIGVKSLRLGRSTHELEFLSASDSGIDDNALLVIAEKCPNLMFLNVSDCKGLTSKGVIEVVVKCAKLKEINLRWCKNVSVRHMLPWMKSCRPSLRRVLLPGIPRSKSWV